MAVEFKLPALGENIETIQVARLLVKPGDTVAADQPVMELETDKAAIEVPCPTAGTVRTVHVSEGDEVEVGRLILTLDDGGASAPPPEPAEPAPASAAEPAPASPTPPPAPPQAPLDTTHHVAHAREFKLPALGENIHTIQVARVMVKPGDTVAVDQPVLELETDKATIEIPSAVAGTVTDVLVRAGDEIEVGQLVLKVDAGEVRIAAQSALSTPETPAAPARPAAPPAPPPPPRSMPPAVAPLLAAAPAPAASVPAAPSVRRFAREIGIEIGRVPGSGPHGRVAMDDVKRFARQLNAAAADRAAAPAALPAAPVLPAFEKWGAVERRKMSVIRRKTAEHMALSWSQIPHVTIFDKADITELDVLRRQYASRAEKAGGKLTMAVMVCKVAASALKSFPKFNASVDMANGQIVYKQFVHLGVAVNTERGLVVPVIREADRKNMVQIAVEISQLAEKARTGKLALDEMEGGTFTITNLGRICGTFFTPIVNYPEVAILGIGRAYQETAPDGRGARTILPLSLSFDHRVIDGADGAEFLAWIIEAIQQPLVLSLEG